MREERGASEVQMWERLARWQDRWVQHNDYVSLFLPKLQALLGPKARVLEIGPGSGAFTLPLAQSVREIVALEPAATMGDVLTRNLCAAGVDNVRVVPQRVEEGLADLGGPFDLVLASHSLYNVRPIDRVVRELVDLAPQVVILMGTGERRAWFQSLYHRFKGRERVPPPHVGHFYPVLLDIGILADVEIVWTSYNYVFESEGALLGWWAGYFGLEAHHDALRSALLGLAERRDGTIGLYDRRRTAWIRIDRARSLQVKLTVYP